MVDLTATLTCPRCHRKLRVKYTEMVPGRRKRCYCGFEFHFNGADGRRIQREVDGLEQALKRLNRRLR